MAYDAYEQQRAQKMAAATQAAAEWRGQNNRGDTVPRQDSAIGGRLGMAQRIDRADNPTETEIGRAMRGILQSLETLQEYAQQLDSRLTYVTAKADNPARETATNTVASRTQMGDMLNGFASRIDEVNGILARLLGTLEI